MSAAGYIGFLSQHEMIISDNPFHSRLATLSQEQSNDVCRSWSVITVWCGIGMGSVGKISDRDEADSQITGFPTIGWTSDIFSSLSS